MSYLKKLFRGKKRDNDEKIDKQERKRLEINKITKRYQNNIGKKKLKIGVVDKEAMKTLGIKFKKKPKKTLKRKNAKGDVRHGKDKKETKEQREKRKEDAKNDDGGDTTITDLFSSFQAAYYVDHPVYGRLRY